MRSLLAAALILSSSAAFAQQPSFPPNYNLVIESKDIALLAKGLIALPYGDVANFMNSLQQQINDQNAKWAKEHNPAPKADKKQ